MILFLDTVTPKAYHPGNIDKVEVGASEKTAMMIAEFLSHHDEVLFAQPFQDLEYTKTKVRYTHINNVLKTQPKTVVILRNVKILAQVHGLFPKSNLIITLDDIYQPELFQTLPVNIPVTFVCKSKWHMDHIRENIEKFTKAIPDIRYIYNPVDTHIDFSMEKINYDKNKLLFASSPHKGLEYTIKIFQAIRQKLPKLTLYVANPGYKKHNKPEIPGVVYLDRLSYGELQKHMKESLCLFYPNFQYPETFGCVVAEANYAGTPVLAHPFGALPEIMVEPEKQLVDCRVPQLIYEQILRWQMSRLSTRTKKEFDISNVGQEWLKLLEELEERKEDLTLPYEGGPLKILMIQRTNLAALPNAMADAINRYTEHHIDLSPVPKKGYHIIHYQNIYIPSNHQCKLIQYNSEPERVTRREYFPSLKDTLFDFPQKELVLGQYHATLDFYRGCEIIKNVINWEDYPKITRGTKVRIGYSPSSTQRLNEFADKGYEKTKKILEEIRDEMNIEIDIIMNAPLEECIRRKSKCHILIDECITGSFHRSGLEGLALGAMTICYLSPKIQQLSIVKDIPFENVKIENLKEFLRKVTQYSPETFTKISKRNKQWMEKNWHPREIAEHLVSVYKKEIDNK